MKKRSLQTAAFLCCSLLFCACSAPGTANPTSAVSSSISENTSSEAAPMQTPAQENSDPAAPAAPIATGFANLSRLNNSIFGSGGQDGFYETYAADNGGVNVVYIDYATANEIYLCSAPNCTHDSDACTAWLGQSAAALAYSLPDGRLLLHRPDSESTVSTLLLANADGSDPAELFCTADVIRADMADNQWLYIERYAAEDDAAQNALYRLPLDGGEPEWLMDLEMGQNTSAGVIGCLGRELIYYSFDWGDDTVPPEAMNWTAEEWEAWDAGQTGTHKVEAINVDTGARRQLAAWTSRGGSAGYACAVFDGMLYRTPDNAQGDLLVTDIASGSERTVKIQWPFALEQARWTELPAMAGGKLLVDVWGPDSNEYRIAVDPATGDAAELTLKMLSNGHLIGIQVLGDSGADLLVCFEIRMMDITDYSPDGTLTPATRGVSQYALISTEDFLASRPGYRTLQTDHPLTM